VIAWALETEENWQINKSFYKISLINPEENWKEIDV
jgi:hypothetical protein